MTRAPGGSLALTVAAADFREVAPYAGSAAVEAMPGDFRRVVFTSPRTQLTVMTLKPGEEIGTETHDDGDQLFVILTGQGHAVLNGVTRPVGHDRNLLAVPQGTEHNVVNSGHEPMQLATVYSPPQHAAGTVHHTRGEAATEHTAAIHGGPWYHGTHRQFKRGDLVEMGHPANDDLGAGGDEGSRPYVYAATTHEMADYFADEAASKHPGSHPAVYEVRPTGPMEVDPELHEGGTEPEAYRSAHPLIILREHVPGKTHVARPEAAIVRTAAQWAPSSGIFGPTTGLDHRLFTESGELRPAVREAIMTRLDRALRVDAGLAGSDWQRWLRVYLAGGSASEWAGSRPNEGAQDLDVLIGADYESARKHSPAFAAMSDAQVDASLNAALRGGFNETSVILPRVEGTWDLTGYVNHAAFDVRAIRPYAAYDVSGMRWAVRPPHLPSHSLSDFDPAVIAQARAVAAEARAILRMPEPLRTREARALWERIHAERSQAFSEGGQGWTDPGNVAEKWLAYAPRDLLGRIRELALTPAGPQPGALHRAAAYVSHDSIDWGYDPASGSYRDRNPLPVLYHGTNVAFEPGDHVEPGHPTHYPEAYEDDEHLRYVHATPQVEKGWQHADNAVHEHGGRQHVYEVEPTGHVRWGFEAFPEDYESDEEMHALGDRMSEHPFRVVREVPYAGEELPFTHKLALGDSGTKTAFLANVEGMSDEGETRRVPHEIRFDQDYHGRHRVSAWPPGYQGDTERGNPIGSMHWHPETGEITVLYVHRTRQGIATALWNRAHEEAARRGIAAPAHSSSRTPAADAWARSVGGYLPPLSEEARDPSWIASLDERAQFRPRVAAYVPEGEPAVRDRNDLGWGPEEWAAARREPWHAAAKLAQDQVRRDHWRLGLDLPKYGEADEAVQHLLRRAGFPGEIADGAFVSRHPHPEKNVSNPAWLDGNYGVALHPQRRDYGTAAHEFAHHRVMHDHAVGRNEPQPDEQIHGPEWAGHYATLLNLIGKHAGDDFLHHHQRFRAMIDEGLRYVRPRDLDQADEHHRLMIAEGAQATDEVPSKTKEQVNYRKADDLARRCGTCSMVRESLGGASLRCTLVKGLIDSDDVCDEWDPASGATGRAASLEPGAGAPRRVAGELEPRRTDRMWDPAPRPMGRGWDSRPLWQRQDEAVQSYLLHRGQHDDETPQEHAARRRDIELYGPDHKPGRRDDRVLERYRDRALNGGPIGPDPHGPRYDPDEIDYDKPIDWGHPVIRREASAGVLYHSGGREFPGEEDWVHLGTRLAALNRAKDWQWERERRGDPAVPVYLHAVELGGKHSSSTETDEVANQPGIGDHLLKGGHTVMPYLNEYEDPGTTSYLAHRSAVRLLSTERLGDDIPGHTVQAGMKEAASGYTGLTGRSAMIYLDLPEGTVRQVKGGVDDHHVTVVYLGKDVSDEAFAEACRRAKEAAARTPPLRGFIGGVDTFDPSDSSDGKVPAFVPAYLPGIGELRKALEDLSASEHRQYRPHVTIGYYDKDEDLPGPHPTVPLSFDRLHVKRGDDVISFPLAGASTPRTAAADDAPAFYHGSYHDLPAGVHVNPEGANEEGRRYLQSGEKHVFYTDDMGLARTYGPKVYRVRPVAPVTGRGRDRKRLHDPEPGFPREYEWLSTRGFQVIDAVDPEEAQAAWDDRSARRWRSKGGQETIRRIIERGDELPESAKPHYKPAKR